MYPTDRQNHRNKITLALATLALVYRLRGNFWRRRLISAAGCCEMAFAWESWLGINYPVMGMLSEAGEFRFGTATHWPAVLELRPRCYPVRPYRLLASSAGL